MVKTINELGPSPLHAKALAAEGGQASFGGADVDMAEITKVSAGKKIEVAPVQKT
jgi:hypothetical protein